MHKSLAWTGKILVNRYHLASTCQQLDLLVNCLAQNKSRRVSDKLTQSEAGGGVGGRSVCTYKEKPSPVPWHPLFCLLPSAGMYKSQKFTCVENGLRTDSVGRQGFNPWSGKILHAKEQLSPGTTIFELELQGPGAATSEPTWPRACAPHWEKPRQREARMLLPESGPCLLQLERSPRSNKDSAQAKVNRLLF